MRTFGQLKYDIGLRVHDVSAGRMETIGKYVNAAYEDIWNAHLWKDSLMFDVPVDQSQAQSGTLTLPSCIDQVVLLTKQKTGEFIMPANTHVLHARIVDRMGQNSGVQAYTRSGVSGVRFNLVAPSTVRVCSDKLGDRQNIVVRGTDELGIEVSETLLLEGGTCGFSSTTFSSIDFWAKQTVSAGIFTLEDQDGNILDRLSGESLSNRYVVVKFDAGLDSSLFVTGKKRFSPLAHDAQTPILPVSGSLFSLALAETLRHIGKYSQASSEEARGWAALDRVLSCQDIMVENCEQTLPCVVCSPEDGAL